MPDHQGTTTYADVLASLGSIKLEKQSKTVEDLFWQAEEKGELDELLSAMIETSYFERQHLNRELVVLKNLVEYMQLLPFQKKWDEIRYQEDDINLIEAEVKQNAAEVNITEWIDKARLLFSAYGLIQTDDPQKAFSAVYEAFTLGYNLIFKDIKDKYRFCSGFSVLSLAEEFECDYYNLPHEDKKYRPSIISARESLESIAKRSAPLVQAGFIEEDDIERILDQGFDVSLGEEGLSYLLCIPAFEEFCKIDAQDNVEKIRQIFAIFSDIAQMGYHVATKYIVDKILVLQERLFGQVDRTIYDRDHNF